MRLIYAAAFTLAACSQEANHLGNPLLLPVSGVSTAIGNAAYNERRGRVEVIVKSNFDAIIADINAGGGPVLTEAMDAAGIPAADRPARIIQLQSDLGLYAVNPGALVVALMVYGG
ncbi:hypothetical protein SLH49_11615 [Cognatiyoonia sp. IB215446]|uniref:hypothetical protein n=1 Tax=Cognatiyoonia sp. IB215446 TaxID=3097355 RepID=UPI002A183B1A|nr:hypothetical protein [Cognatiyoonia sp. IB215446]MDX8348631.1 hypothetical protein [Cognatiyoonia sp. IB215446]